MKTAMAIVMALALVSFCGCQTTSRGGSVVKDEGFRIGVPSSDTQVKQGEMQTVIVSVKRDSFFRQDVKLLIKVPSGISIEPASVTVKASDKPDVQFRIAAPKDAALGEYPVVVKGTPETGAPTSVGFTVKVIAP